MALAVTACDGTADGDGASAAATQAADKAGAIPAPVTLRLGTEGDEGTPVAEQIKVFADLVGELSGGMVVIQPVWKANGDDNQHGWDQAVARKVVAGDLDMGMIPARAWDTEGVSTMRALHAPFLVTTDELSAAIATSDLADEMLAGLEAIGVTGLALAPESVRHLLVYGTPPATIGGFKDLAVRSPRSDTTYALFEALGAKPDDFTDPGESFDDVIAAGLPAAAESSFALGGTLPGGTTTAIGNLPLFPKVNSLVINSAAFARLSEEQRAALRSAATQMVSTVTATMPDTVGYAEQYCHNGGTILLADGALLAELRRAVQPVYADLEVDPITKSFVERITALGEEIDAQPAAIAPCAPAAARASPSSSATASNADGFPEGVYRKEVTLQELLDAGIDRPTAQDHLGMWTLTFQDGQFLDPGCPNSTYSVVDDRITVTLGPRGDGCGTAAGKVLFSARWTVKDDELQFTDVRSGHGSDLLIATLFGGRPYIKIG
jgi:TRAP-type C4-dicarboxylate transport system substrate-binding protein